MAKSGMTNTRLEWETSAPRYIRPSLDYVLATQLPKSEIEDTWTKKDVLYLQWDTPYKQHAPTSWYHVDPGNVRILPLGSLGPTTLPEKSSMKKLVNLKLPGVVRRKHTECWRCAWVKSIKSIASYPRSPYTPTSCWEHDED